MRRGLGLDELAPSAYLVAHFRASLRQLLSADGQTKLKDLNTDSNFDASGDVTDRIDHIQYVLKGIVRDAVRLQWHLHGLQFGSYNVRFTPIDHGSLWGFDFDEGSMELGTAVDAPGVTPGEALTPVKLVSDPMLVVSGLDGLSYDKNFTVLIRMFAWTLAGDKGGEHGIHNTGPELGSQYRDKSAVGVGSDGARAGSEVEMCEAVKVPRGVEGHEGVGVHKGLEANKANEGTAACEVCEGAADRRWSGEWEDGVC